MEQIHHLELLEKEQQESRQFKSVLDEHTLVSETDIHGNINPGSGKVKEVRVC